MLWSLWLCGWIMWKCNRVAKMSRNFPPHFRSRYSLSHHATSGAPCAERQRKPLYSGKHMIVNNNNYNNNKIQCLCVK